MAETERNAESELDVTPTTRIIQILVRDEEGTLTKALQIFSVSKDLSCIACISVNKSHN